MQIKKSHWSDFKIKINTDKFFRNLIKSTWNQIVFTISNWFGSKRMSVCIQINWKTVNTIWFQVDLIRLRKNVSVCTWKVCLEQEIKAIAVIRLITYSNGWQYPLENVGSIWCRYLMAVFNDVLFSCLMGFYLKPCGK